MLFITQIEPYNTQKIITQIKPYNINKTLIKAKVIMSDRNHAL